MSRILCVVVALASLLGGCVSGSGVALSLPSHPQPSSLAEVLANVKGDTIIDLNAADAIAVAHGDAIAHACYPVLAKYVAPATGVATVDQIAGVVSAFEKARVERKAAEAKVGTSGIPDDLRLGCAALLQDERDFIVRLAVMVGGASVGVPGLGSAIGGAAGAIPAVIAPLLPR